VVVTSPRAFLAGTKGMVVAAVDDTTTVVGVGAVVDDEVDVDEQAARKRATPKRGSRAETPSRLPQRSAALG
jgi:hypothetical protein